MAQTRVLRLGELDAALVYAPRNPEFCSFALTPEPLVVAMASDHRLAAHDFLAFEDLSGETFILPSREVAEVLYYKVVAECAESGFAPHAVREVATAQTALGLVSAHLGISVLPASVNVLVRQNVTLAAVPQQPPPG